MSRGLGRAWQRATLLLRPCMRMHLTDSVGTFLMSWALFCVPSVWLHPPPPVTEALSSVTAVLRPDCHLQFGDEAEI